MGFASTAAVTAAILVMLATRRLGAEAAGLLAGLPYTTVPALVWIGSERGAEIAAQVAIGSVVGCTLCAVFAAVYDQAARRFAPAITLPLSLSALLASFAPMSLGPSSPFQAGALALIASAIALTLMRPAHAAQPAAATTASVDSQAVIGGLGEAACSAVFALCVVSGGLLQASSRYGFMTGFGQSL